MFTAILAFREPSNPFRIWNEPKEKFLVDFRRRKTSSFGIGNDFQSDSVAESYVLNKIQNSLRKMTGNLDFEKFGPSKIPSDFSFIAFDESLKPKGYDEWQSLDSTINRFNKGQAQFFNSILSEILPRVTVADP